MQLLMRIGDYGRESLTLNSTVEVCQPYNGAGLQIVQDEPALFEDKALLEKCVAVIEAHLDCEEFNVQTLARLIGVSHSVLYRRIKQISGLAINPFVRSIRLRRAAELIIKGELNISESAMAVGIYDIKYFREQFVKVYGETPSEYGRRCRLKAVG